MQLRQRSRPKLCDHESFFRDLELTVQTKLQRGLETEARVIRGVAEHKHHVMAVSKADLKTSFDQFSPHSTSLPIRCHRHRTQSHCPFFGLRRDHPDRREENVPHEFVPYGRHQ